MKDDTQDDDILENLDTQVDPSDKSTDTAYTDDTDTLDTDDVVIDEDADSSPQDLIKKLRTQLKTAVSDKQTYLENWQREKAEFINIRKRDEESKQDFIKFAEVQIVEELIPVLDSCREALKFSEKAGDESGASEWIKGIKSIYDKLISVGNKRGLEEYANIGDKFDPNIHQSISSVPTDKKDLDETIASVLQKGYKMKDKIVRPALVSVYQV